MQENKNIKLYLLENGQAIIGQEINNNHIELACWMVGQPDRSGTHMNYAFIPVIPEYITENIINIPKTALLVVEKDKIDSNIYNGYETFLLRYKAALSGLAIPQEKKLILNHK